MKKIALKLAAFAAVLLTFTGCNDGQIPDIYYLNVAPNAAQSVEATATSFNFIITSNVAWTVYVDGVFKHSGTSCENENYLFAMPANESTVDPVVYNVVFKSVHPSYETEIPVTITQAAAVPYLYVEAEPGPVPAEATSWKVKVSSNISWIVKVNDEQQGSGVGDKTFDITFPANKSTDVVRHLVIVESADPDYETRATLEFPQDAAAPYLRAERTGDLSILVPADATSCEIAVESNISWTVKVNGVQQASGVGDKTFDITFPANGSTNNVAHTVIVESADPGYEITISGIIEQEGAEAYLRFSPEGIQTVPAEATSFEFTIESNISWEVEYGDQKDSGVGDKTFDFTFPANRNTYDVIYTVTVESTDPDYEMKAVLQITQSGAAAYLTVDQPGDRNVDWDALSVGFMVQSNISWTMSVNGASQIQTEGNASPAIALEANTSTTDTKTTIVTFEPVDFDIPTITVKIIQAKKPAPVTYTETFSGFTTSSSSYTGTGTYTSTEVDGVKWSYKGATNQGSGQNKAKFVLGRYGNSGTNYSGFVRTNATVPGGVSYIAVDWIIPLGDNGTGYNGTSFKVMVNGTQVGSHTIQKSAATKGKKGTFVIENLNIIGDVIISIESNEKGRPGINKIVWKTNP